MVEKGVFIELHKISVVEEVLQIFSAAWSEGISPKHIQKATKRLIHA